MCSGSKADGLFMNGSDLDVVRTMFKFMAYQLGTSVVNIDKKKAVLFMDHEMSSPGYARLWIHDKNHPQWRDPWIKIANDGLLFSSSQFRDWMKGEQRSVILERYNSCMCTMGAHDLTGPCISSNRLDQAFSIVCQSWPESAMPWFSRKRPYNCYTDQMITRQLERGILLVPIKSSEKEVTKYLDNRISWLFTVPPETLVHSLRVLCYVGTNENSGCCKAVLDLKDAVENNRTVTDPYFRYISYKYLRGAYELANDIPSAMRCHEMVGKLKSLLPITRLRFNKKILQKQDVCYLPDHDSLPVLNIS
ncbi:unnamed protein product [Mytilus edulis]|uniref:Uncharacterized protein n=1 Tax=Mytilus edulis TaxID=6550 RepID=A0A8S3TY81_MYTED|nr:unnamed protein product [Mytilus edulis]